jgi:hypothetical protein
MIDEGKKGAAQALFMAGYQQVEIARILNLSHNTISKWSATFGWKEQRVRLSMMENNTVNDLMEIFDYQVRCLKKRKVDMETDGEMKPFAPGEFDALQKLYSTIKPDWQNFRIHVEVLKKFVEYVQAHNLELAKQITEVADMYILEKSRTK